MLDSHFKFLWVVKNYVGAWGGNSSTFEYDVKAIFPLLLIFFNWFNPISQTCVINVDFHNSQFEKEENSMFGVRASMEKSSHALVVGNFSFLRGYLSSHLHV